MHRTVDNRWILSATDLVSYLACPHLGGLTRAGQLGFVPWPPKYEDPGLDALRARGEQHERDYRDQRVAEGRRVVEIAVPPGGNYAERCITGTAATKAAMRAGADVIYQAWLVDERWAGRADFLVRTDETPSALGGWSYEVADTKLAREAKGGALLQILLYSDLLERIQGVAPEKAYLALGGPEAHEECFRVKDYAAYFRSVRDRYLQWVDAPAGPLVRAPDPVAHCEMCDWIKRCEAERREVDHLSFVAGITRRQRGALVDASVTTLAALAHHPLPPDARLDIRDEPYTRVREQARVQYEGRERGEKVYELLPIQKDLGFAALPSPSPGDLFLDFEGDPFALTHGLEYLVGWADVDGHYSRLWALDRGGEKAAFEAFVDLVTERRRRWPDMHVYHYAPYERTALGKLMGLHATREDEVDAIFRSDVLVDLYRIVRQGVRASVESYSIKKMEPFYGFRRSIELNHATRALVAFSAWLQAEIGERAPEMEATIEAYNKDDVLSTLRLRDWLEELRADAERAQGVEIPRPVPRVEEEGADERDDEISRLVERLTAGVPAEEKDRSSEQHGRWLTAHLLEYHRREDKPAWWAYFHRLKDMAPDELVEDRVSLGGIEYAGEVGTVARSVVHHFSFPPQEHGIKEGSDVTDPEVWRRHRDAVEAAGDGEKPKHPGSWSVERVDDAAGAIFLKKGPGNMAPIPHALVPCEVVRTKSIRDSLFRLATAVAEAGLGDDNPYPGAVDLLMRRPPPVPLSTNGELVAEGEDPVAAAVRITGAMRSGVLAIQGPPGAGKTYTASHLIAEALASGRKVGVTANSHAVITHLLDRVCELSQAGGFEVRGIQKDGGEGCEHDAIEIAKSNERVREALDDGANLAAGTAWLWSREEMAGAIDLLVIDEAGQFALANALAVAPAARVLVLVGDPQQLEQPVKGTHPPGVGVSALNHLLGDDRTIRPERGLFLPHTRRLHPDICRFTSEVFYDGRLEPVAGLEAQAISGPTVRGSGLRLATVHHAGCTTESAAEAGAIARLVEDLLARHTWIDRKGFERPVTPSDVLVVAPYNVQVGAIGSMIPAGVKVGTVDKFQGREAPVVIYSTTSSTAEEAPRGMDFLYSPNRLNVATSRAMCLAIVVASPEIFAPECRTPAQMKLANAFCRFAELAEANAGDE